MNVTLKEYQSYLESFQACSENGTAVSGKSCARFLLLSVRCCGVSDFLAVWPCHGGAESDLEPRRSGWHGRPGGHAVRGGHASDSRPMQRRASPDLPAPAAHCLHHSSTSDAYCASWLIVLVSLCSVRRLCPIRRLPRIQEPLCRLNPLCKSSTTSRCRSSCSQSLSFPNRSLMCRNSIRSM